MHATRGGYSRREGLKILGLTIFRRDHITGSDETVYMRRWILLQCPLFSVRLHKFMRSDHDVLHDHPWSFFTLILSGGYWEDRYRKDMTDQGLVCRCGEWVDRHTQMDNHAPEADDEIVSTWCEPLTLRWVPAETRHRVRLEKRCVCGLQKKDVDPCTGEWHQFKLMPCWSLVVTGPPRRRWGFWCPKGWVHWKEFLGEWKGICR